MPKPKLELQTERQRLAANLRNARIRAGKTQMGLTQDITASRSQTVGDWERGRSTPTLIMAVRVARVLGVTLDELTKGVI